MKIGENIHIAFITLCLLVAVAFWGVSTLYDIVFANDPYIEAETPISPEIKIIVKDNKVDTLYIYKQTD